MSATNRSAADAARDFGKSLLVLLFLPWLPLIVEFLAMMSSDPKAERYLERPGVVLTASILAASVAVASKSRWVCGAGLVTTFLLAAMYGSVEASAHKDDLQKIAEQKSEMKKAAEEARKNCGKEEPEEAKTTAPGTDASKRTFWDKLDMDDFPGIASWIVIATVSLELITERGFRHLFRKEPWEWEWEKE